MLLLTSLAQYYQINYRRIFSRFDKTCSSFLGFVALASTFIWLRLFFVHGTYLDAIHYKVREESRYISKAFYTVLGVNLKGKKEILGLYLNESEGSRFWMQVLTDLQNRGVKDILIASVDGLKGFPEAINAKFNLINCQSLQQNLNTNEGLGESEVL